MSKTYASGEVRALVAKALLKYPDVFPGERSLSRLSGVPSIKAMTSPLSQEDWARMQINWIRTVETKVFLSAFSNGSYNRIQEGVEQEVNIRLLSIVNEKARTSSEFQTPERLGNQEILLDAVVLRSRIPQEEWTRIQIDWIRAADETVFLSAFSNGLLRRVYKEVMAEINNKLTNIVGERAKTNPDIFPTAGAFSKLPNMPGIHPLLDRVPLKEWTRLQIQWIKKIEEKAFLDFVIGGGTSYVSAEVDQEMNGRLVSIIEERVKVRQTFPTIRNLKNQENLPSEVVLSSRISQKEWIRIQIAWIKTTDESNFLTTFQSGSFTQLPEEVNQEIRNRLRSIALERIKNAQDSLSVNSLSTDLGIGNRTLSERVPDIQDLLAISGVLHGARTPDQQIVSRIGLRGSEREAWVNQLFEERLEQLWLFREAVALAGTGHASNSTIISFAPDSLSQKLAAITGVSTIHVAFEHLEDGRIKLSGEAPRTVILLSVLQWLSPERTARLLRNLSASTVEGDRTIFTYPMNSILSPGAEDGLRRFGFELERIGTLSLFPPENMQGSEAAKLEQHSKVAIMRRLSVSPEVGITERLDLLTPIEDSTTSNGNSSKCTPRTYQPEELRRANPVVTLCSARAEISEEVVPEITQISLADNSVESLEKGFLLTFSSGEICGVNLDPRKPNTVEIEGTRISESVVRSCSLIAAGREPSDISVAPELRELYTQFIGKIRKVTATDIRVRTVKEKKVKV